MSTMAMDPNTELRNLPSNVKFVLANSLDSSWTTLMENIPRELGSNGEIIDEEPKYNAEHVTLIERYGNRCPILTVLDEWGTSGRVRPTLKHLLVLSIRCDLFRAADYISDLLHLDPPERPSQGPAAHVAIPQSITNDPVVAVPSSPSTQPSDSCQQQNMNSGLENKGYIAVNKMHLPTAGHSSSSSSQMNNQSQANPPMIPASIPEIFSLTNSSQSRSTVTTNRDISLSQPAASASSSVSSFNVPNLDSLLNIGPLAEPGNRPLISDLISYRRNDSTRQETAASDFLPNLSALNLNSNNSDNDVPHFSALMSPPSIPLATTINNSAESSASSNYLPNSDLFPAPSIPSANTNNSESVASNNLPHFSELMPSPSTSSEIISLPHHFSFNHIQSHTNFFNEGNYDESHDMHGDGRKLGEGGFSDVFLAIDLFPTIKYSAVKKLRKIHEKYEEKFLREIELLSQLKHPNLVNLLGYSNDCNECCLVYEFVSGGNLKEKLLKCRIMKGQDVPWQERINIGCGIAIGIKFLHDSDVIHRDIKSANVMLDAANVPKICDFGLIRDATSNKTTIISGTNIYMAPETNRGDITTAIDVYAFGVVLLELVTGREVMDRLRPGFDLVSHFETVSEEDNYHEAIIDWKAGDWGKRHNNVGGNESFTAGHELLELGRICLDAKKTKRPTIEQIIKTFVDISNKF